MGICYKELMNGRRKLHEVSDCRKAQRCPEPLRGAGAKERGQGYLQGNGYIVSWCVGHLIGLAAADSYDPKYSKWCYEDLPIIPKQWKYAVAPDKKEQYEVLVSLMNRPDVASLVCATDAGREGELIFRLVYDHAGCRKPFERLWISSMEDSAIREGFQSLHPGSEYDRLYEAAPLQGKSRLAGGHYRNPPVLHPLPQDLECGACDDAYPGTGGRPGSCHL